MADTEIRLDLVATVAVPGAKKTCAKDRLASANIEIDSSFPVTLLDLVEKGVEPAAISIHFLRERSLKRDVLAKFPRNGLVNFHHALYLVERQSKGQEGHLDLEGNIFARVMDRRCMIWELDFQWKPERKKWHLHADIVDRSKEYIPGQMVAFAV